MLVLLNQMNSVIKESYGECLTSQDLQCNKLIKWLCNSLFKQIWCNKLIDLLNYHAGVMLVI